MALGEQNVFDVPATKEDTILKVVNAQWRYIYENSKKGDTGAQGVDGVHVKSVVLWGSDTNGGNIYNITFSDNTVATITAPQGARGARGEKGDDIGVVSMTLYSVDTSGNYIYRIMFTDGTAQNIVSPKGERGERGAKGEGAGDSAYQIWLNNGNKGTEQEFLDTLKGKDGIDGKDGKDGGGAHASNITPHQDNNAFKLPFWNNEGIITGYNSKNTIGIIGAKSNDKFYQFYCVANTSSPLQMTLYAPETSGNKNQIVISNGNESTPTWANLKTINGQSIIGDGDFTVDSELSKKFKLENGILSTTNFKCDEYLMTETLYLSDYAGSTALNRNTLNNLLNGSGGTGVKGDKGDPGEKGDKGDPGAQGIQGVPGVKGDTGAQGIQGVPGAKGDKGDKGDTGAQGVQGLQGIRGLPGEKGDKGDPGTSGEGTGGGYVELINDKAPDFSYSNYSHYGKSFIVTCDDDMRALNELTGEYLMIGTTATISIFDTNNSTDYPDTFILTGFDPSTNAIGVGICYRLECNNTLKVYRIK